MPRESLNLSTLKAFEMAAAGHAGSLSSASGDLFIKPCTREEIDFYQTTQSSHSNFAEYMPRFIGTLQLGAPQEILNASDLKRDLPSIDTAASRQIDTIELDGIMKAECKPAETSNSKAAKKSECNPTELQLVETTLSTPLAADISPDTPQNNPETVAVIQNGPEVVVADRSPAPIGAPTDSRKAAESDSTKSKSVSYGMKLETEIAIVLENLEHGFRRPNVLDIKLGSRLWADEANTDKRQRLDKVAAETTSGSLNFRMAGMKVWNGRSYDVYDKHYGRRFNAENVHNGFETFFSGLDAGLAKHFASALLWAIEEDVVAIKHLLEASESRMYGTSLLIVYEGDATVLNERLVSVVEKDEENEGEDDDCADSDSSAEGDSLLHAFKVRMIDFAHSAWTPGWGEDENVIKGIKNVEDQIERLLARYK